MESVDRSTCEELSSYIDKLVTDGEKELDSSLLKKLKSICKKSDLYVEHAFHIIMTYLDKEHAQIRYSCLGLIDELFQRSHAFRNLLLTDFQRFLELTAETDPDEPLPPPINVAKHLKIRTLEVVQEWHNKFGDGYKKLKLAYNFLRTCKKIDFNNLDAHNEVQRRREEEERQQQARIALEKIASVTAEMEEFATEITSTIKQLDSCLHLLLPSPDELFHVTDFSDPQPCCSKTLLPSNTSDEQKSSFVPDEGGAILQDVTKPGDLVKEHGLGNMKYSISVNVEHIASVEHNENTADVIENMKELLQQVQLKFIPMVTKWLQILVKEGNSNSNLLRKAIDLKNDLKTVADKCSELKICTLPNNREVSPESDDDFEEVLDKEGFEPIIPEHRRKDYGLGNEASNDTLKSTRYTKCTTKDWSLKTVEEDEICDPTSRVANVFAYYRRMSTAADVNTKHTSGETNSSKRSDTQALQNDIKKKLLSEAPRRPYDIDLYFWEEEKLEPPEIIKFDSQHKFWKPHEPEITEIKKQEDVAALRMRRIEFTGNFVPVKWSCRAPLPSGRLCPRQDRHKCPFHGPIIPRDELGNPTLKDKAIESPGNANSTMGIPDWQDPQYLQELKAATGIDLELPSTSKALKKTGKKKTTKKYPGLIDIKKAEDNTRNRLEKKVMNKSALKRVAETLDTIDQKRFRDKYGNQWQYSFET